VGKITTWIGGREGVEESGFAIMQREVGEYQEEDRGKRNWGGEKEGETECRVGSCSVWVFFAIFIFPSYNERSIYSHLFPIFLHISLLNSSVMSSPSLLGRGLLI